MKSLLAILASTVFLSGCLDTVTTASTANRHVLVSNRTGVTMVQFFASNSARSSWEEDILGTNVLPSGRSVDINIDDGSGACSFDFKAVFADGDVVVENGYDVCRQATWTVY